MSEITNQGTANAVNALIAELQQTTRDTASIIEQGREDVIAIVSAASPIKFYDTYAQALGDAANIPIDGLIEVFRDEIRNGARTRYFKRTGNVLEFAVNLDQLRKDLLDPQLGANVISDARQRKVGDVLFLEERNVRDVATASDKLKNSRSLAVLCIGDSITYGYDVNSPDIIPPAEGHIRTRAPIQYPAAMQEELRTIFNTATIEVTNLGYSGDTAKTGFERWPSIPAADIAIVMYGINDGTSNKGLSEYVEYMSRWVDRLQSKGIAVAIALSTLRSAGAENEAVEQYRNAADHIARQKGCALIDCADYVQNYKYSDIYSDGTHFNAAGYKILGKKLAWAVCADFMPLHVSSTTVLGPNPGVCVTDGVRYIQPAGFGYSQGNLSLDPGKSATWIFHLDADAAEIFLNGTLVPGAQITIDSDLLRSGGNRVSSNELTSAGFTVLISSSHKAGALYLGRVVGRGYHSIRIVNAAVSGSVFAPSLEVSVCDALGRTNGAFSVFDPALTGGQGSAPGASATTQISIPAYKLAELIPVVGKYWAASSYVKVSIKHVSNAGGTSFSECVLLSRSTGYYVQQLTEAGTQICKVIGITGPASATDTTPFTITLERPNAGWLQMHFQVANAPDARSPAMLLG